MDEAALRAAGFTDDEIKAYLGRTDISARNLGRSAIQGATFNFGDEVLGVLPEWMGGGTKAKEEMRSNDKAFKGAHPVVSGLANVAGGLVLPGGAAMKALGGAGTIGRALLAGGALGGISGALSGAGAADNEDLAGRASAAVTPGLLGAAAGAAIPFGAGLLKAAVSPSARAAARLETAIQRSGGTAALAGRAKAFDQAGRGAEVALGDLSKPLQQATDFAANASDDAAEKIGKVAYGRQADASERILGDVQGTVGNPHAEQIVSDLEQGTSKWAKGPTGYGGLRANNPVIQPQDADAFGKFLNSPKVKDAWNQAKEIQLIGAKPPAGPISFDVLQGVADRLKTAKEGAFNKGANDLAYRLKDVHEELIGEMQKSVPGYSAVAKEYATRKGLESAVKLGEDAFDQADSRGLAQLVGSLDPDRLTKLREGMASKLITQLRSAGTNRDAAKKLVDASPAMRDKLGVVFGDKATLDAFMHKMEMERELSKMLGALGGSATARRLAAQGADPLDMGVDLATHPTAAVSTLSKLLGHGIVGKVKAGTATRMAPALSTQGTPNIEALLQQFSSQRRPMVGGLLGDALPVGLGVGMPSLLGQ